MKLSCPRSSASWSDLDGTDEYLSGGGGIPVSRKVSMSRWSGSSARGLWFDLWILFLWWHLRARSTSIVYLYPVGVVRSKVESPRSSASCRDFAGCGGEMMIAGSAVSVVLTPFGGIFDAA